MSTLSAGVYAETAVNAACQGECLKIMTQCTVPLPLMYIRPPCMKYTFCFSLSPADINIQAFKESMAYAPLGSVTLQNVRSDV